MPGISGYPSGTTALRVRGRRDLGAFGVGVAGSSPRGLRAPNIRYSPSPSSEEGDLGESWGAEGSGGIPT